MKCFDLIVPDKDNKGRPYDTRQFLVRLLVAYGGYTVLGSCYGTWRDPSDNKIYHDASAVVRVIGDTSDPAVLAFFEEFQDQKCLAMTSGADAWLIDNPNG